LIFKKSSIQYRYIVFYNVNIKNMTKKDNKLYSEDELEFFKNIEEWNYNSMKKEKLENFKNEAKIIAKNTIEKKTRKKALNIRLFQEDILKIKAMAIKEGLPYQTYLASIIHKFSTWEYKEGSLKN